MTPSLLEAWGPGAWQDSTELIDVTCHRTGGDSRSARRGRHKWEEVGVTRVLRDLGVGMRRCLVVPAPAQPVGLCAFLGGGCSRFWVGSEVVSSLRKLLYWPEAQVHSDGRSAGGWPEFCQGPLLSHVLWPVACSQDSAASTATLCPHISLLFHCDSDPLLAPGH